MPRVKENSLAGLSSSSNVKAKRTVRGAALKTARPSRSRYRPRNASISASCTSAARRRSASSSSSWRSSFWRALWASLNLSLVDKATSALCATASADWRMTSASREPSVFILLAASVSCSAPWRSERRSSRQARSRRSSSTPRCSSSCRARVLSFRHCVARVCVAAKTSSSWSPAWANGLQSKVRGEAGAAATAAMLRSEGTERAGADTSPASACA
mmetsp:Transcript_101508/g.302812  ORF Transcript_101508/g.302812 Transcript_101508/m.302812 type:complete len:216 (+) Transcript_101508:308-955(+)